MKKLIAVSGKFLIDTNIIVDFLKGDLSIGAHLANEDIFIPSIVIGELYFGAYVSRVISNREKRLKEVSYFLEHYPTLSVDDSTSNYYGQIKAKLKARGVPIPENDIWIAAIAIEHHLSLVTKDKHFDYIEDMETIVW